MQPPRRFNPLLGLAGDTQVLQNRWPIPEPRRVEMDEFASEFVGTILIDLIVDQEMTAKQVLTMAQNEPLVGTWAGSISRTFAAVAACRREPELRSWMEAWSIGAVYEMYVAGELFFKYYRRLIEAVYKDKRELELVT